jgi:signal transduction histidine kinase
VYLLDPAAVARTAETLKLTFGLLIAILLVAIAIGSWLIFADLRRQLRLAQQKTDFVSNVSHELKTPLTSIRMFSELLADGRQVDEEKRRTYLQIIHTETARLTRLINGVLDFARMDRGERQYRRETFDLAELTHETLESVEPQLAAAGFQIESTLPPAPVTVKADRDAIAQVLLNLLSNAEKYSAERREIRVELESPDGSVELRVLDRGTGVPRGCERRIFEQFFRGHDSLASGVQGTGLGLTLAQQIATAHDGELRYRPREGGGSCFTLHLPTLH